MKMGRPIFAFTFAATLGYVVAASSGGCTNPPSNTDAGDGGDGGDAEVCNNDPTLPCAKVCDCGKRTEYTCYFNACTRLCKANSDCQAHQPGAVCDDGVCTAPACGTDDQCSSSQQCSGGACINKVQATTVNSCKVLPESALLHIGEAKPFFLVAYDTAGAVLPYKGTVTWGGTAGVTTDANGAATGATAGDATVTATVGTANCHANVKVYAAATNKVRVLVANANTGAAIEGATVIVDGRNPVTTGADGTVEDGPTAGTHDVHVFKNGYKYVSYLGVASADLAFFLHPNVVKDQSCWDPTVDSDPTKPGNEGAFRATIGGNRRGWRGLKPKESFKTLDVEGGEVHIGLFGTSIPGSLLDINLTTLIGDLEVTSIKFGQTPQEVPLPSGAVLGLSDNMFKRHYCVFAEEGVRTAWGIGGNSKFNQVIAVLGPALNDPENINAGSLISGLLPLFGKLQAGAVTALPTPAAGTLEDKDIPLSTRLRLRAQVAMPQLPQWKSHFVNGAVVLASALHRPQGTVPLGLTAGIDVPSEEDCATTEPCHTADGYVTNPDDPASVAADVRGKIPVRFAPLHSGLETSENSIVALALDVGSISTSNTADSPPTIISGLVAFPGPVAYDPAAPPAVTFSRGFLGFAETGAMAVSTRTFTLTTAVAGAHFNRLDIENAAGQEWDVYFKPATAGATTVVLPDPHATDAALIDPLVKVIDPEDDSQTPAPKDSSYTLQSAVLAGSRTYESVLTFNGENTDDMSKAIEAFSTTEIELPQ